MKKAICRGVKMGRAAGLVLVGLTVAACAGKYVRETNPALTVKADEDLVERGRYLVDSLGACGSCHTQRGDGTLDSFLREGERTDRYLAGGNSFILPDDMDHPMAGSRFYIPNITPDPETGIGDWSDDELIRGIRDGIHRSGRLMFPMMPFNSYQHMSDRDVHAIVAYLRSVPPIKQEAEPFEPDVGFMGNLMLFSFGVAHHEPVTSVPHPDPATTSKEEYGEYVMRLGHCWECHSMTATGPVDKDDPMFMAGNAEDADTLPGIGKVYFRNLTQDEETGLGKYSAEQIKRAMQTGRRLDGKVIAPPMSLMMPHYSTMSEEDHDALAAYLKSLPAVKNAVPERELDPKFEADLEASASAMESAP